MRDFLLRLIKLYQLILSPYLGGRCRFHPSCSEYAISVVKTQPLLKALFLIIKRLLKCHPLGPHGVDLPPSKKLATAAVSTTTSTSPSLKEPKESN